MKISIIGATVATLLLGACGGGTSGGGGSGSPAGSAASPASSAATPAATVYRLPVYSTLDVASYRMVSSISTESDYLTLVATAASAAGTTLRSIQGTYTGRLNYTMDLDASGGLVRDDYYSRAHDCRYAPVQFAVPATVAAGATWDNAAALSCTASYEVVRADVRSVGAFVAFEPITVAAGTFDTVKLRHTDTSTLFGAQSTEDVVEWRDLVTGYVVKRMATINFHGTRQQDTELIGYTHAASGRSKQNVERYAGSWHGILDDTASSACTLKLSGSGVMTGYCNGPGLLKWQVNGTVDALGAATLVATSPGLPDRKVTGTFSPLRGSGSWTGAAGSGGWDLAHS